MIKPGDLALLKTSEEMVFVLAVDSDTAAQATGVANLAGFTNTTALVRRPIATSEKGIQHVTERFLIEELETQEDKRARMEEEIRAFRKLASNNSKEDPSDELPN